MLCFSFCFLNVLQSKRVYVLWHKHVSGLLRLILARAEGKKYRVPQHQQRQTQRILNFKDSIVLFLEKSLKYLVAMQIVSYPENLTLSVPDVLLNSLNLIQYFSLDMFGRILFLIFSLLCLIKFHFLITKCLILYVLCKVKLGVDN